MTAIFQNSTYVLYNYDFRFVIFYEENIFHVKVMFIDSLSTWKQIVSLIITVFIAYS